MSATAHIRLDLPVMLQTLAKFHGELVFELPAPASMAAVLDALELRYPSLRGTVRDLNTRQRRAYLRFFACMEDISHRALEEPLPPAVQQGREPVLVIGAVAGG
ncbi:MAG: MoaD/ThiS family protein [Acidobacteriota bacterium]|nr:MoaD/ThiS family protein [Acidobacteriota bacterium]